MDIYEKLNKFYIWRTQIMKQELKPCPFCGSDAMSDTELIRPKYRVGFVECLGEECHVIIRARTEKKAIELWNRRAYEKTL
jgi:Lar family restriction alleviation protein